MIKPRQRGAENIGIRGFIGYAYDYRMPDERWQLFTVNNS